MRYQPDHKEKTRRRVLEEATKAIRRQGPHRLGIARVMKQAGLTHGGAARAGRPREAGDSGELGDRGAVREPFARAVRARSRAVRCDPRGGAAVTAAPSRASEAFLRLDFER